MKRGNMRRKHNKNKEHNRSGMQEMKKEYTKENELSPEEQWICFALTLDVEGTSA